MRLEFTILWFENQPADIQAQVEEIKEHIAEVGFIPRIRMERNAEDLKSLSRNQKLYNDFDLVVVDYDLGVPGKTGDHVAKEIRRTFGFTDIIFYSGLTAIDLRKLVHDQRIDGVYCLSRPDLSERLSEHIEQVVSRLSRLEAMRGLVMGTVGRCDDVLRKILLHNYGARLAQDQSTLVEKLDEYVESAAVNTINKYEDCTTFQEKLDSRAVTSFHLQKLALYITRGKDEYREGRQLLKQYNDAVLRPRNVLGHAVETRNENGWVVTSTGIPTITSGNFAGLRKDLAIHFDNLVSLHDLTTL